MEGFIHSANFLEQTPWGNSREHPFHRNLWKLFKNPKSGRTFCFRFREDDSWTQCRFDFNFPNLKRD